MVTESLWEQRNTVAFLRSRRALARWFWRARAAIAGSLILVTMSLVALAAPWIAPYDPVAMNLSERLLPPSLGAGQGVMHPCGTDQMGRDVLSRLFYGARVSLVIGLTTVVVSGAIGVLLGLVAGYFGGLVGDLIMRIADVQESFPFLALAIVVVALLGPGLRNTIIVLGVGGWVLFARVVRGDVLGVREKDYILAARALGVGDLRMMFRHILPNVVSPVIVLTTFAFSLMIITEASLSFIGLGVQPPAPSWGRMLGDGRDYLAVAWWLPTFPGLFIMLTVLGANLLGDCLRDMLDPRLRI